MQAYGDDLAYIHDVGHGDFARRAAPALLALLRRAGFRAGLVIDLGCGSGIWAEALAASGYDVLGIDQSPAMIGITRERVPAGEFRVGSFLSAPLPPCIAVTAVGECLGYLFDRGNTRQGLSRLFRRIHDALCPGGLLIFDMVGPGRVPRPYRLWREGEDWAVLVEAAEDRTRGLLTRRITSFRKVGTLYRRTREVHRLRLSAPAEVARQLRSAGFRARVLRGYGALRFGPGHAGFMARKP